MILRKISFQNSKFFNSTMRVYLFCKVILSQLTCLNAIFKTINQGKFLGNYQNNFKTNFALNFHYYDLFHILIFKLYIICIVEVYLAVFNPQLELFLLLFPFQDSSCSFPVLVFYYVFRFCLAQSCCNLQGYQYHSRH